MDPSDSVETGQGSNHGRHRAPDRDAQTAYIPRITDASPDGVPGGPLAPPAGLSQPAAPPQPEAREQVDRPVPRPVAPSEPRPNAGPSAVLRPAAPAIAPPAQRSGASGSSAAETEIL